MNRRHLLLAGLAAPIGISLPRLQLAFGQEATPEAVPNILNIRWQLERIVSGDNVVVPDRPEKYWVQFRDDGFLAVGADCNRGRGQYTLTGSSVGLGEIATTRAYCGPTTVVDEFLGDLKYVVSYLVTGDLNDQLVLEMMADGGQLFFNPVLPGAVWRWLEFQSGDGTVVTASDPNQYSVEFLDDGTVRVQADCNTGFGPYTVDGSGVDLTVASTKVACPEGSQSTDFLRYLDDAVSYVIKDGRLWLSLMADAGIAVFDPAPPSSNEATPVAASGG